MGTEFITGTSAVNDDGCVLIFCPETDIRYDQATLADREIRLTSSMTQDFYSRTYGLLTCEAIRAGAPIFVQPIAWDGSASDMYRIGG